MTDKELNNILNRLDRLESLIGQTTGQHRSGGYIPLANNSKPKPPPKNP